MECETKMEKDQAEHLRVKAAEISEYQTSTFPSRSEVHGKQRNLNKKKEKDKKERRMSLFWVTRLLLCAFILLIGFTVTYKYWSQKVSNPVHSEDKKGVEQVKIER
jgi:cytoskeletal protein RodZ